MDNSINILGSENSFLSSTPKELERANAILEEILSGHVTLNTIMSLYGRLKYFDHVRKIPRWGHKICQKYWLEKCWNPFNWTLIKAQTIARVPCWQNSEYKECPIKRLAVKFEKKYGICHWSGHFKAVIFKGINFGLCVLDQSWKRLYLDGRHGLAVTRSSILLTLAVHAAITHSATTSVTVSLI